MNTTTQNYVNRTNSVLTFSVEQTELASCRESFDLLSVENLDNIVDYFATITGRSGIQTVNHLLQVWLTSQHPDLSDPTNLNLLKGALGLVDFLTELDHLSGELSFFKHKIDDLTPQVAPACYPSVSLVVATTPDNNGSRSELTLLREALSFYETHLRSQADTEQNPTLLLDAGNLYDMQANLTDAALSILPVTL